jgi:tRNA-Thr(GGU) m(6)t(6)A37 methyltransferase TsaA
MSQSFAPIGVIHSCFKEKFGIPRQAGVATEARATLELYPPYGCREALQGLEGFSHLWIIFVFHQAVRKQAAAGSETEWRPTVRPPRLGGNRRIGVFASRSPFRPNPIGLSAVALDGIRQQDGRFFLDLRGADLLDGTPVLDIKPYLPYADALPEARDGYAQELPAATVPVSFEPAAADQCAAYEQTQPGLRRLIEQVLGQDPRPAYYAERDPAADAESARTFGMRLYDFDLRWRVTDDGVTVIALHAL